MDVLLGISSISYIIHQSFVYRFFARVPSGASMILAELAMEAGLPNGVLNIVHGTNVSLSYYCYNLLFQG